MPQSPLLVDQVQIEPGSGQTLLINRNSADGSLRFRDAVIPSGILLRELAGLQTVTGVYIVGTGGAGATYTSIQDAIDAVPNSSSASDPSLILVLPGVYTENVTVGKDGVAIVGLGGAYLINSGANDTVTVLRTPAATPNNVLLKGLTITNTQAAKACVRLDGSYSFASATITVVAAPINIGDTITINGVNLVGVCGARTPGGDNFNVGVLTPAALAVEIAAAINDPANSFAGLITATPSGANVTLTANLPGAVGNAYTLALALLTPGQITISGPTFTGGGASASEVGLGEILIEGCNLIATSAGGYNLYADTVNHIRIQGGTFRDSAATATVFVSNCSALRLFSIEQVMALNLGYDTSLDRPSDLSCFYSIIGCGQVGDIVSQLLGAGSISISNCPQVGNITLGGDQSLEARSSTVGDLDLSDTMAVTLVETNRSNAVVSAGTPTLAESKRLGFISFAASVSETVTFDVLQPDVNYVVTLDIPSVFVTAAVSSRTTSSFVLDTSVPCTGDINYAILRQLP
jgi:hypothetical protein